MRIIFSWLLSERKRRRLPQMRSPSLLLLSIFAALSSQVNAFEWTEAYFRGTPNNWSTTLMTQNFPENVWEITVTFGNDNPRFKISREQNWNEAYPAEDFLITQGPGTYKITFEDFTQTITVTREVNPSEAVNSTAVCFDNNPGFSSPTFYAWDLATNTSLVGAWPGITMQQNGAFFCHDLGEARDSMGVIFNDNAANQTVDLTYLSGLGCYQNNTWTTLEACGFEVIDTTPNEPENNAYIYFDNTATAWLEPHAHLFAAVPASVNINSVWPGFRMEAHPEASNIFQVPVSTDLTSLGVVFNDNTSPQTADLTWTPELPCYQDGTWVRASACGIVDLLACEDDFTSLVPAERGYRLLTREEYQNTLQDLLDLPNLNITQNLPEDDRVNGFETDSQATVSFQRLGGYIEAALFAAEQVADVFSLAPECQDESCVVANFGKRALRRPLTSAEMQRYTALLNTPSDGKNLFLGAVLASPALVKRSELGALQTSGDAEGFYRLDSYEIATLLSYTLLASTPDAIALNKADAGTLQTPAQIREEAQRLLSLPRAEQAFGRFVDGYLSTFTAIVSEGVSEELRDFMAEETRLMVKDVVFTEQGTFADLMTANFTWVNSALAQHYGMSGVPDDGQFHKVFYTGVNADRRGVLGQGRFLASTSGTIFGNPVRRGLYVRNQLLCQPIFTTRTGPVVFSRELSIRERYESGDRRCDDCENFLDGIGFGLGNYDQDGLFQTQETLLNGEVVDINTFASINNLNSPETRLLLNTPAESFSGAAELSQLIADSTNGPACYARQYYRYINGTSETVEDACTLERAGRTLREDSTTTLMDMMLDFTQVPNFGLRKVSGE